MHIILLPKLFRRLAKFSNLHLVAAYSWDCRLNLTTHAYICFSIQIQLPTFAFRFVLASLVNSALRYSYCRLRLGRAEKKSIFHRDLSVANACLFVKISLH